MLVVAMKISETPSVTEHFSSQKVFTSREGVGDGVTDGAGLGQLQPEQSHPSPKVVSNSSHVLYPGSMLKMYSHVNPSQKQISDVGDGVTDGAAVVEATPPPPPPHKQHIVFEVKSESS